MNRCSKTILALAVALALAILLSSTRLPASAAPSNAPPPGDASPSEPSGLSGALSPQRQLSVPASGDVWGPPAVAYNSRRHSQVMFTHRIPETSAEIYGRYWSERPGDWNWFPAMSGIYPAVAYNRTDDNFLLVAMRDSNHDGRYELWSAIVKGDGSAVSDAKLILEWTDRNLWRPRVAWNSYRNQYLVVFEARDVSFPIAKDVAAALLNAGGLVLAAPLIVSSTSFPQEADVTYNPAADEYLVVWRKYWSPGDWDILGARMRGSDGTKIEPPGEFLIGLASEDERFPSVAASDMGHYMVIWEHAYSTDPVDWDIRAQELDESGARVGEILTIAATTRNEQNPRVVARPGPQRDFLAIWEKSTSQAGELWARRWGDSSTPADYFLVASSPWWSYTAPAVAVAGPSYLFAYQGDDPNPPITVKQIYSRTWSPFSVSLPALWRK